MRVTRMMFTAAAIGALIAAAFGAVSAAWDDNDSGSGLIPGDESIDNTSKTRPPPGRDAQTERWFVAEREKDKSDDDQDRDGNSSDGKSDDSESRSDDHSGDRARSRNHDDDDRSRR